MAYLVQCLGNIALATVHIQFLNLVLGSFWLFVVIAEDIANDLAEFNLIVRICDRNRTELMKRFCGIVKIYADAQQ